MSVQTEAIYRFNAMLIKLPMAFFTELEERFLHFVYFHRKYRNTRKPLTAKAVFRKKNGNARINLHYKITVIKTVA